VNLRRTRGLLLGLIVLGLPALAHAKVTPAEEGVYGGVYAADCNNINALRVRLYGDVMTVERSGKAVSAKPFKSSKTAPSGAAPSAFKIAYVGEVKGGDGLVFVMTHDASGLFVTLQGGPKSLALLGPGAMGQKLRHCDPNRNALPGTLAPKWMAPSELLRDPKFKSTYLKALGPLSREPWLATLSGPAPQLETLRVGGIEMRLAAVCKPHDCGENNSVLLYDAAAVAVYGKVYQAGRTTLLGNPGAPLAAELDKHWRQQWRSGK
jgi:Inhibitor of vertebrate lysozyme (Ivy)